MATRGLYYIKPFVPEFGRKIRLYLDSEVNSISYISASIIDSLNPNVIERDNYGEFVDLDLIFKTLEGQRQSLTVRFQVLEIEGNDFVLGDDVPQDFSYDSDGIMFNEGEVRVYIRG